MTSQRRAAAPSPQRLRPAFYALPGGGWRDYVTLLHPPYTAWHLSYVVLGAGLAPSVHWERLAATLLAFFLAVGVSAHALDELKGRPLGTGIPRAWLWGLAVVSLAGALAVGALGAVTVTPWLWAFIVFGVVMVPAYNLEWLGGRLHGDLWFAFSWGSFPLLASYWANGESLGLPALVGAMATFALSLAQRCLSRWARTLRRRFRHVSGEATGWDGAREPLDALLLAAPAERALLLLALATVVMSVGVLLSRA
jgi:hypothetical protein